jgi:hypothetical protein
MARLICRVITLGAFALLAWALLTSSAIASAPALVHSAQSDETIQCGDEVQGEFFVENAEVDYYINLEAGDILILDGYASDVRFVIQFHAPDDTTRLGESPALSLTPKLTTIAAPVQGRYNVEADNNKEGVSGGVGVFRLRIGCLVRNGAALILPFQQQNCPDCQPVGMDQEVSSIMRLPALNEIAPVPLEYSTPVDGTIASDGGALGYRIETDGPQALHLIFTRGSGILSLGLAVVGESGYLFQGGIIGESTQSLEARVTLPAAGEYIIAIYSVDVFIPATAEPTVFTLYASPE